MYSTPDSGQIVNLPQIYMNEFGYINNGFFVDCGAYDGVQWSNTFTLACAGWSGIMIEPVITHYYAAVDNLRKYPNVKVVNLATGSESKIVNMYVRGSVSTASEEMAAIYDNSASHGHINIRGASTRQEVQVVTLNDALENYGARPGFEVLSIDVEGMEYDTLIGLDIAKWKPRLVLVEAYEQHEELPLRQRAEPINDYFTNARYEKIYSDHINNVYRYPQER